MSTSGAKLTSQHEGLAVAPPAGDPARLTERTGSRDPDAVKKVLKSYFYWTFSRGSVPYDVMVTLILAFIFITPWLWDYGDKPRSTAENTAPVVVQGYGGHGLVVTLAASDVNIPPASPDAAIKKALKKAMEPVLGDVMVVERWEITRDQNGNPVSWKVWAHR
jgi:hypothetical protein